MPATPPSTFSIVAHDPRDRSWGVAVQSKFLACGSIVPWARADVGALATQGFANARYGSLGLALLEAGRSADAVVAALLESDPDREFRQVAVVDGAGRAAAFTGSQSLPWAGHIVAERRCFQGNCLTGEGVLRAMSEAWAARDALPLAERLVAVLEAGQGAGGDTRGQQSAALVVVRDGAGFLGYGDRLVDLRVDDHPAPIRELGRLLALHRATFGAA